MCTEDSSFNSISDIHHQKEDLTLALRSVYAWTDWTSIRFSTYRDFLFLSEPDSAWATRKGNEIFGEQDGIMGGSGIKAFAFLLVVNCRVVEDLPYVKAREQMGSAPTLGYELEPPPKFGEYSNRFPIPFHNLRYGCFGTNAVSLMHSGLDMAHLSFEDRFKRPVKVRGRINPTKPHRTGPVDLLSLLLKAVSCPQLASSYNRWAHGDHYSTRKLGLSGEPSHRVKLASLSVIGPSVSCA
ncbi:hypothetical protein VNO80_06708 [Phaseolus coccineus]|uniref:Uncharacterized protein n=1 Tax=Phaseolus coccineus TaxID=3886 RepID=A0AAN9NHY6_PHACN